LGPQQMHTLHRRSESLLASLDDHRQGRKATVLKRSLDSRADMLSAVEVEH